MARAAVKAKQQAKKAQAQPAKPRRGRRKHSGGGNPNQQLFFMKLRRGQKWLYALLAVIFAVGFAGIGVGSGNGGGLDQLYSGIFGGSSDSVSKAQKEVKSNPVKGYRDLANAYVTKGDIPSAISALQNYVALRKKDANAWTELGGYELQQARTYGTQYQAAAQAAQLADPSTPFQPSGTLATAVGTNAAFQQAGQVATTATSSLLQQYSTAANASVSDYQKAANLQPRSANAQQLLASAAENTGNFKLAIASWRKARKLSPANRAQINANINRDQQQLAASTASTPKVKTHK